MNRVISRFIITAWLVLVALSTDTMTTSSSISSNLTLMPAVTYNIEFWLNSNIDQGSSLELRFSTMFNINGSSLSDCKGTIVNGGALGSTSCAPSFSTTYYSVTFSSLFSSTQTISYISLQFKITNPVGDGTETIEAYIFSSGVPLTYTNWTMTYEPSTMTDCSISSSSDIVGATSTYTVRFTPIREVYSGSSMQVRISPWGSITITNFVSSISCSPSTNAGASMSCSNSSVVTSATNPPRVSSDTITASNVFPSLLAANNQVAFSVTNMRNPPSTQSYGPFNFYILYGSKTSQTCTNILVTVSTPGTLVRLGWTGLTTNRNISAFNSGTRLSLRATNSFPSSGYVRLTFPSGMVVYAGALSTYFNSSTEVSLTGFQSSNVNLAGSITTIISYNVTYPPSTRPTSIIVHTLTNVSGSVYLIDTYTETVTANAGAITTSSVSSNNVSVNFISTVTVTFTTLNNLVSGSIIRVQVPSQMTIQAGATCSSTISTSSCGIVSTNATITLAGPLTPSSVTVTINSVKNPPAVMTTSSFKIISYYDSLFDSLVDTVTTGITLTSSANAITIASVTPSSTQVNQVTSYTFSITLNDPITMGGYFDLIFPSQVTFSSPTLTILSSSMENTCTLNVQSSTTIRFSSCFSTANRTTATPLSFSLSSIKNPSTFAQSSAFTLNTYDSAGRMINFQSSQLSSLTVTMDTEASLTASISLASNIVHTSTTYTFDVTFSVTHVTGDKLIVTLPTQLTAPTSPTCTSVLGFSSVTCSPSGNTVVVDMSFTTFPSDFKVKFNISSILNYDIEGSLAFTVSTTTSTGSKMEKGTGIMASYVAAAITSIAVNNDENIALLTPSNVSLTITAPFSLSSSLSASNTAIIITIPSGFTIGTSCTTSTGTCAPSSAATYTVTAPGLTVSSLVVVLKNITLPYYSSVSNTFSVSYQYSGAKIAQKTSGIVVGIYCTSPCKQCTSSKTTCLSCLPAPNTLISYNGDNNTCVLTCPDGKYNDANNICQPCQNPCSKCTSQTACTSCVTGTWLSGSSCLSVCPDRTFNDSSGVCLSCISPCDTCSSLSSCKTCLTGYLTGTSCVAANSCPAGTYPEALNKTCSTCTNPCQNCDTVGTNCTSCVTGYLYYSNQCVVTCPDGMYASGANCLNCVSPCGKCTGPTTCLTCTQAGTYLSGTSCITTCPAGTYAETSNSTCSTCTAPCSSCSISPTNCTSCRTSFFYYNNLCYSSCPSRTYASSNNCFDCIAPCDTCSSSSICLTCLTNFLSSGSCVATCPAGTYAETSNKTCSTCTIPCSTCSVQATNCTSCTSGYYYYSNQCVVTCPDGMYASGVNCATCQAPCGKCTGPTTCLTCTQAGTYLSGTSCITTCPAGTYAETSNSTCSTCTAPCSFCSISASNCTSCTSGFFYYNNLCLVACPTRTYASGVNCVDCVVPCDTCVSATTCSSCLTNFLSNGACISTCPTGTYADTSTKTCATCPSNCTACSSPTFCSACATGFNFINNECLSTCPTGTFSNGTHCQSCTGSCTTCQGSSTNCTGCTAPAILYNNSCYTTCPTGTYQTATECILCNSSCSSCTSATSCNGCKTGFFLLDTTCYSVCPGGYYGLGTNCLSCTAPCATCAGSDTTCLSCSVGYLYQGNCLSTCPQSTAPFNGVCTECGNCIKCIDVFTCETCKPGFYSYAGKCYDACPSIAPIVQINMTCSTCDPTCLTCDKFVYNCTSCFNGRYLYRYECVEVCPSGMIGYSSTRTCIEPIIGRIVFFPGLIFGVAVCLLFAYSKYAYRDTELITAAAGVFSLAEFISWNILTYVFIYDYELENKMPYFVVGLVVTVTCLLASIAFTVKTWTSFCKDDMGHRLWLEKDTSCKWSQYVANTISCFMFRFYRLIYSRLFGRVWLNAFYGKGQDLLILTRNCTYVSVALQSFPMVAMAGALVYFKRIRDQTYYNCIDLGITGAISIVLCMINCQKNLNHFDETREQLGIKEDYENLGSEDTSSINAEKRKKRRDPNKKYRNSWEECIDENRRRVKTDCGSRAQADKLFRNIKFTDPNKFGHLNVMEPPEEKELSLPEYDQLFRMGQEGDQNRRAALKQRLRRQKQDNDNVVMEPDPQELQRLRLQEQRRKQEELREQQLRQKIKREDEERLRKVQQEMQRRLQEEQQRLRKEEEERERLRREEEDALQQVNITFQDKIIISKELDKGVKKKQESPVDRLKKFKSTQDRKIDDKEMKKLQELAILNGLDKQFVKNVLGKEKSYNPQLLKAVMGKYSHFPKQLLQKLFNPENSVQVLETLFGKDSTLDPEKLKEYFGKEPFDQQLFHRLFHKDGLNNPELVKEIFELNSKISPDFVHNVLGDKSPASQEKLQQLFEKGNMPDLKHLKKVFGQDGLNTEIVEKMLGEGAPINFEKVKEIVQNVKPEVLKEILQDGGAGNNILSLLNDENIDLKALSKILKNQEAMSTIDKLMREGDTTTIDNLKRLIRDSPNMDPKLLDQFLSKPELVEKLLGCGNLDPQLLKHLLAKDAKTDLEMFEIVMMNTPEDSLKQIFEFSPQKNIDFAGISVLFEKDKKTNPLLIEKLFDNPNLMLDLYTKGNNDPHTLKKLFEHGRDFNPQLVRKLYGKDKNPFLAANYDFIITNDRKNNEDQDYHSMNGDGKGRNQEEINNMSRTEGLNFIKPRNFVKFNQIVEMNSQTNLLDPDDGDEESDDDGEQIQNGKKKKKKLKAKPKKVSDIRLDAQKIYLQRIEAPNEKKMREIRKKKKKKEKKAEMDSSNEEYDLNF